MTYKRFIKKINKIDKANYLQKYINNLGLWQYESITEKSILSQKSIQKQILRGIKNESLL